ncbi:MAG: alcohol dehydrogenase catalytic domain-containing protein, partial [Bryobacterales bacterium]|nr:alcohol dehydrogenase catalytic domain-containing protein [Bryobacterales bacterium]
MRALALDYDSRTLHENNFADPCLKQEGDVLFRVLEVGVCGTDRALVNFAFGYPPAGERRLILGHEALGMVEQSASPRFRAGDLVAPLIRRACESSCRFCATGRRDLCETSAYTERGIMGAHGYFADLAVDHEQDLVAIPAELRGSAVLLEPLSVVEKAIRVALRAMEHEPRSAVVLGAGPIGYLSTLALLARGIAVTVASLEPDCPPLRAAGADYRCGNPPHAEIVVEATGSGQAAFGAIGLLSPGGAAVILGAMNTTGEFPFHDLIVGNRKVIGSVNTAPIDFEAAVEDLRRFPRSIV